MNCEAEESCFVRAESLSLDVIEAGYVRVFEKTAKVAEALVNFNATIWTDTKYLEKRWGRACLRHPRKAPQREPRGAHLQVAAPTAAAAITVRSQL